jgi:hypothetical protein
LTAGCRSGLAVILAPPGHPLKILAVPLRDSRRAGNAPRVSLHAANVNTTSVMITLDRYEIGSLARRRRRRGC